MHLHGTPEQIKAWKEESDWIGRNVSRIEEPTHLVIYPIAPKKRSRPNKEEEAEDSQKPARARRGNGHTRNRKVDDDE